MPLAMWGRRFLALGISLLVGYACSSPGNGGPSDGGEGGDGASGSGNGGSRVEGGVGGTTGEGGMEVSGGGGGEDSTTGGGSGAARGGTAGVGGSTAGGSGEGGDAGGGSSDCIVYVNASGGNDANEGESWLAPLESLSAALEKATPGCEVWIVEGMYRPGTELTSTFLVPDGVTLRGGFVGDEVSADGRDIALHPTILTGDLDGEFGAAGNSRHVVTTLGEATLDGLAIVDGYAYSDAIQHGGGILAGGSLTLRDCTVRDNGSAENGAGVFAPFGLSVSNTTFFMNYASWGLGGAIYAEGPEPVSVLDSTIYSNEAAQGAGIYAYGASIEVVADFWDNLAGEGASIWVGPSSATLEVYGSKFLGDLCNEGIVHSEGTSVFDGCEFANNPRVIDTEGPTLIRSSSFTSNGAGVFAQPRVGPCDVVVADTTFENHQSYNRGAGIWSHGCPLHVNRCTFRGNATGEAGAAIDYFSADGELLVENSVFEGNTAASYGGAVHVWNGSVRVERSTFTLNTSLEGGALAANHANPMLITACRFVENSATFGGAVSILTGSLDARASEFQKNSARYGAVVYRKNTGGPLAFTNATFSLNVAEIGAAVDSHGSVVIRNSILWANQPNEIVLGTGSLSGGEPDALTLAANNLSGTYPSLVATDPKFVDPAGDLRLSVASPCIDMANDAFATVTDLLGRARRDEPGVPVCPDVAPTCGSIADLGAYEFGD
jgi:hypothetical protein